MKFDFKEILEKIKEFWGKLADKTKKLILAGLGAFLLLILLITILINVFKGGYQTIFPGMSNEESRQVYATLQEMGVQPKIDDRGQVQVPSEMWDQLVFELNGKGYPKTTLSYDTFASMNGFTATEFEKRTGLIFEAQDRAQKTLLRQSGIEDAVVTFTVPETSNYIWDQTNQQKSTGSVSVRMKPGAELTPERVTAIRNLAATSIPKLDAADVVVIDAATGIEMPGVDDASAKGYYSVQRLEYEQLIAKRIEDNVKRLLAGRYGTTGVTAVASVTLDYDKMMTETKQYQPNNSAMNHFEEDYSPNGRVEIGGLVGEENNTAAPPSSPNDDGSGNASATDYHKHIDYDISYIMTQIEKGEPLLQRATVAVIVDDPDFNIDVEETLIDLISKAVSITSDNISVTNLNFSTESKPTNAGLTGRQRLLLILGLALLFVVLLLIAILIFLKMRKKKPEEEPGANPDEVGMSIEKEIEEHKRMLQSEALANSNQVENAITQEIREFAKENPEITAALLRSMLKEDQ